MDEWRPEQPRKPDVVPSNTPYITPARNPEAGIVSVGTPEFCTCEGFTLRALVARLWAVPESRIVFQGAIEHDERFDVWLVPPDPWSVDMEALMRDGIATHFGLDISFDVRPMEVLVLSAPNGIIGMDSAGGGGVMSFYGTFAMDEFLAPGASFPPPSELSLSGSGTIEMIRDTLERLLDRLVVDETGAEGVFDVDIRVDAGVEDLLAVLRDQSGIVATPSRREVRMLVVKRR